MNTATTSSEQDKLAAQLLECAQLVKEGKRHDARLLQTAGRLRAYATPRQQAPRPRRPTWHEKEAAAAAKQNKSPDASSRGLTSRCAWGGTTSSSSSSSSSSSTTKGVSAVKQKNRQEMEYQRQKQAWEHLRNAEEQQQQRRHKQVIIDDAQVMIHAPIDSNHEFETVSYGTSSSSVQTHKNEDGGENTKIESIQVDIPSALLDQEQKGGDNSCTVEQDFLAIGSEASCTTWTEIAAPNNENETRAAAEDHSSCVQIASVQDWDDMASFASASDFEQVAVHGSPGLECKQCTFRNRATVTLCGGCGGALVPNPCVDVDFEIARQLAKESGESHEVVRREHCLARLLPVVPPLGGSSDNHNLLEQSQTLKDVLHTFIRNIRQDGTLCQKALKDDTIAFPTEIDLLFQVSSFIEQVHKADHDEVALAYVFTNKYKSWQILKQGFDRPPVVSQNMEGALRQASPLYLPPVSEHGYSTTTTTTAWTGYLVAITNYNSAAWRRTVVTAKDGTSALVLKLKHAKDALPLVCFDAAIRQDDLIRQFAFNGFSRILGEFFAPRPTIGGAETIATSS